MSYYCGHISAPAAILQMNLEPVVRMVGAYKPPVPLRMPFHHIYSFFPHVYLFRVSCNTRKMFHHATTHASRSNPKIWQNVCIWLTGGYFLLSVNMYAYCTYMHTYLGVRQYMRKNLCRYLGAQTDKNVYIHAFLKSKVGKIASKDNKKSTYHIFLRKTL